MGTGMRRNSSIFQSTLPQGERHNTSSNALDIIHISIHAPARGATAIITNFHTQLLFKITIFSYIASPLSFPISLFPIHSSIFCAIFQVRIPHRFYVSFRFAPDYKISVWSAAVPRSTPICSTFVWYLFPR